MLKKTMIFALILSTISCVKEEAKVDLELKKQYESYQTKKQETYDAICYPGIIIYITALFKSKGLDLGYPEEHLYDAIFFDKFMKSLKSKNNESVNALLEYVKNDFANSEKLNDRNCHILIEKYF